MSDAGVEKPRSKSKLLCPKFHKPQNQVCHKCVMWEQIRGRHPQSGEEIDRWGCVFLHEFLLDLERNKVIYEQGAAIESLRNEMVDLGRMQVRAFLHGNKSALAAAEKQFRQIDEKNRQKLLSSELRQGQTPPQVAHQVHKMLPPPTAKEIHSEHVLEGEVLPPRSKTHRPRARGKAKR